MSATLQVVMQLSMFVFVVTSMLAMGFKPAIRQTVALPVVAVQSAVKARPIKQRRKSCC